MEYSENTYNLYREIKARTNGEIYMGVVGPVRCGKSTFIKRFMDLMVIPNIKNLADKERAMDELPQSSAGKMIMTTEPKFIPKDAVNINIDSVDLKVRLIDCVGFMVDGAAGHLENDVERMVKTPWNDEEVPFTLAAEIGTKKVIKDHSTVGIVVTADGSFGDFDSSAYFEAEEKTVKQLKAIGKPFVMILNSAIPNEPKTKEYARKMKEKYGCSVIACDCQNMSVEDIKNILEELLNEFPITEIYFNVPKWAQMLSKDEDIYKCLIDICSKILQDVNTVHDAKKYKYTVMPEFIDNIHTENVDFATGKMQIGIGIDNKYYFEMLSNMCGERIENEYELINLISNLTARKFEFEKVADAVSMVHINGYGVVTPTREQINIEEPVVFHNGNKYGVKIKAEATTIYMIQTNIQTEMAPIVGSEQQAKDLIEYINNNSVDNSDGLWNTNIFGKTIEQIVNDSINDKIRNITDENMDKLRETLQKVMNDNTGIVCLIV